MIRGSRRFLPSCLSMTVILLVVYLLNYHLTDIMVTFRCRLRPIWPHGYQPLSPQPQLLNTIYKQMQETEIPIFQSYDALIPKIVHLSWKNEQIPQKLSEWIKKWSVTNADWKIMFWSDETIERFIRLYYPLLAPVYDSLTVPVQRADMFRYIALLSFGGVWADLDVEPLKSLNPIRDWASFLVSPEPPEHHQILAYHAFGNSPDHNYTLLCNAFMASVPGHPFIFYLLSRLTDRSPIISRRTCDLDASLGCTGPSLLTLSFIFYKRSITELKPTNSIDNVTSCDYKLFLPTFDDSKRISNILKTLCSTEAHRQKLSEQGRRLCKQLVSNNFKNKPVPKQSFTNHHWFHTYYKTKPQPTLHIKTILPNVTYFFDKPEIPLNCDRESSSLPNYCQKTDKRRGLL